MSKSNQSELDAFVKAGGTLVAHITNDGEYITLKQAREIIALGLDQFKANWFDMDIDEIDDYDSWVQIGLVQCSVMKSNGERCRNVVRADWPDRHDTPCWIHSQQEL